MEREKRLGSSARPSWSTRWLSGLFGSLLALSALAQEPTLTFTAEVTSGAGQVVPRLSWSTDPPADSCVAGGAWAGERGSSGLAELPVIQTDATYSLTCSWTGDNDALFKWSLPTLNSDGTAYTNPKGLLIVYDHDDLGGLDFMQPVANPFATSWQFTDLLPVGEWKFAIHAINDLDLRSEQSNVVSKALTAGETAQEAVAITVNAVPLAPVALSVE